MKPLSPARLGHQLNGWRQSAASHPLWRDKLSLAVVIVAAGAAIATAALLALRLQPVDYPVPTHYDSQVTFDATGPWYSNYRIGLFAVGVTLANVALALKSFRRSRLVSFWLLLGAAVVSIFCFIIALAFVSAL